MLAAGLIQIKSWRSTGKASRKPYGPNAEPLSFVQSRRGKDLRLSPLDLKYFHNSLTQQPKIPVIGYLSSISNEEESLTGFRQGLADLGFIEGQNVRVIYRYANGQYEQLPR